VIDVLHPGRANVSKTKAGDAAKGGKKK
ncbi:hypothetical protein L195_g038440, partial [Trifolium pratense]